MNKKQKVEALITANVGWTEEDREWLLNCDEARLDRMLPVKPTKNKKPDDDDEEVENEEEVVDPKAKKKKKAVAANARMKFDDDEEEDTENEGSDEEEVENEEQEEPPVKKKKKVVVAQNLSVEDFIAQAPRAIRDVLTNGVAAGKAEQKKLIAVITGNARNRFSKEELREKSNAELRQLAALAANEDDYVGQGAFGGEGPIENAERDDEPLPLPVMNFEEERKKRKSA